jgi:hypothetical protein
MNFMWSGIFVSFFVLLIVIFVWRFVARLFPHESASPPEDANVFASGQTSPEIRRWSGSVGRTRR